MQVQRQGGGDRLADVVIVVELPEYDPEAVRRARELYARGWRRQLLRLAAASPPEERNPDEPPGSP